MMMLARISRRAAWAVAAAPVLGPVDALAELPGGGGMAGVPWGFLLALALATLLLAGAGFLTFGDLGLRRRAAAQRSRLDRLGLPALISTADGRTIWANAALRTSAGHGAGSILDLLGSRVQADPQALYRIASSALRFGIAAELVTCKMAEGQCVLSARLDEPESLIWTLLPGETLPLDPAGRAGLYDQAPFAHVTWTDGGVSGGNPVFDELFGLPPAPEVLAGLAAGSTDGGRTLLPCRDGKERLFRVFAKRGAEGSGAPGEAMIFPLQRSASERTGASAVLEEVPVALIQFDLEGRVLWHNRLAAEMIGHEVAPGTAMADLVVPLGRPVAAIVTEAIADQQGRREMVRLRAGSETFLQIFLTRVTLDESQTLLAVVSDASELRQLEDKFVQSQKMEAVGKLAGGVAHDFNNVLTAISGHSDLLLLGKDALHPDYSDLIQVRQNTHRAAALVRQLLAFSRKQTLNPSLLSVQDVVSDTQYLLNRLIGERVTLALEHGRELGSVRADQQQLEQALMNLVVNARDAMPKGGTITIATRNARFEENTVRQGFEILAGDYVEISVSDEGSGIEAHVIDRVFEPFFTTKPQGEGTGLGLSTVYGIVKQSGGYIFAENRPEGGARFQIILPRAHPGAADLAAPAAKAAEGRDLTGKGAILLVEDEDPVRSFATRALRLRGYEVLEAASAEDAMEVLEDPGNHIDLLVSDVVMPGTDGPTLAAYARKKRPGLRVVFISGYAEDSFRRNLVDHDFTFLPKPFSLVDLTATVKEALAQPGPVSRH